MRKKNFHQFFHTNFGKIAEYTPGWFDMRFVFPNILVQIINRCVTPV